VRLGDKLILYTDGIVEYQDRQGGFYGEDRFHGVLKRLRDRPISEVIDGVIDAIMDYGDHNPPRDDVTLLGFEFKGESD
jgi:phosphoserine phosphatase RsbU/P